MPWTTSDDATADQRNHHLFPYHLYQLRDSWDCTASATNPTRPKCAPDFAPGRMLACRGL